jgi:CRP-like cAMP-binding protein
MDPHETLLSEYFLSERDLIQLMEHLVSKESNAGTLLGFTDPVELEPGFELIRQGETDASVYILTEGTLDVIVEEGGKKHTVATIEPYALVGEQSFIDGGPRTATVVARTPGLAHRLTDSGFEQVRSAHPEVACAFLIDVSRGMAHRLRQSRESVR